MKKVILVLCVLMLTMTGCNNNKTEKKNDKNDKTELTEDAAVSEDTENDTEDIDNSEADVSTTEGMTEDTENTSETAEENDKSAEKEYVQAYKNVIETFKKEIMNEGNISNDYIAYNVINLDGDDVPELVIGLRGFQANIYTYHDGRVYTVMDKWGYGAGGNSGYFYLPGKNVIRNYDAESAGAMVYTSFYKMNDKYELESYYEEPLTTVYYEDGIMLDPPRYYYGFDQLTKEEFDEYGIDGEYVEVVGEMTEDEAIAALEN